MAEIPRHGRRISPPGPSGIWPGGVHIYDRGLAGWAQAAKGVAGILGKKDEEIKKAKESTELVSRAAEFSLGFHKILQGAMDLRVDGRRATAQEQEDFIRTQVGELETRLIDWKGAKPESLADLRNLFEQRVTQGIVDVRRLYRQRDIEEMVDQANLAVDTATRLDDPALFMKSVNTLERVGDITPAVRERMVAEFPVNAKIATIRRQMDMLDQPHVKLETKLEGLNVLAGQADGLRQSATTEEQRTAAAKMLKDVQDLARASQSQYDRAVAAAQESNEAKILVGIFEGKITNPAIISDLLSQDQLTPAAARRLRGEILDPHPPVSDPLAKDRAVQAVDSVAWSRAKEPALEALYRERKNLSGEDFRALHNRIHSDVSAAQIAFKTEAMHLINDIFGVQSFEGFMHGQPDDILASAKGRLLLDQELQEAAARGEPLRGRDIIRRAIEIAQAVRQEDRKKKPTSFGGLGEAQKRPIRPGSPKPTQWSVGDEVTGVDGKTYVFVRMDERGQPLFKVK